MSNNVQFLKFQICFVSSEDEECPADNLLVFNKDSNGWSTKKYSALPQMMIIRFDGEVQLSRIRILSHENRIAKRIEIFKGNPTTPFSDLTSDNCEDLLNYRKVKFERVGYCSLNSNKETNYLAREVKTAKISITTCFLKFVFSEIHTNKFNYHNQIGIIGIAVIGKLMKPFPRFQRDNENLRKIQNKKKKILQKNFEDENFDKETNQILDELMFYKEKAIKEENFILCEKLKNRMNAIKANYGKILALEREKQIAIDNEDYLAAEKIKRILKTLRNPKLSSNNNNLSKNNGNKSLMDTKEIEHNVVKQVGIELNEEDDDVDEGESRYIDDNNETMNEDDDESSLLDGNNFKIVKPVRKKEVTHRGGSIKKVFHPDNAKAKNLLKDSFNKEGSGRRRNDNVDDDDVEEGDVDEEEGEGEVEEVLDDTINSSVRSNVEINDEEDDSRVIEDDVVEPVKIPVREKKKKVMNNIDDIRLKPPKQRLIRKTEVVKHDDKHIRGVKNPDTFYSEAKDEDVEEDMQVNQFNDEEDGIQRDKNYYESLFSGLKEWQVLLIKKIIFEVKKRPECRARNPEPDRKISTNIDVSVVQPIFGEYLTKCFFSSRQRYFREVTVKLLIEHLEQINERKQDLFIAILSFLKEGLKDRIFQNFFLNVSLLRKALKFGLPSTKKHSFMNKLNVIIGIFVSNFGDNNRKKRSESKKILVEFCEKKKIGPSVIVGHLLKVKKKKKGARIGHWKQDFDRLELFHTIIVKYKILPNTTGLTNERLIAFIQPFLSHTRGEVRQKAADIVLEAYKRFGEEFESKSGIPQKVFESKYLTGIEEGPLKKGILKKLGYDVETAPIRVFLPKSELPKPKTKSEKKVEKKKRTRDKKGAEKKGAEKSGQKDAKDAKDGKEKKKKKRKRKKKKKEVNYIFDVPEDKLKFEIDDGCLLCKKKFDVDQMKNKDGVVDDKIYEKEYDRHMMKDCPMLVPCPLCYYFIEIPFLSRHMLRDCVNKKKVKQCPNCKLPVMSEDYEKHVQEKKCKKPKKLSEANRCFLCKCDLKPGIDGWRKHLLVDYCPSNQRTLAKLSQKLKTPKAKGNLSSRVVKFD